MPDEKFYLKISSEADRATVAAILFRNGYTVSPAKLPKSKKSYWYCIAVYEAPDTVTEGGDSDEA